jgi:hypothetical protein
MNSLYLCQSLHCSYFSERTINTIYISIEYLYKCLQPLRSSRVPRGLDAGTGRGLEFFYWFPEQGNLICRIMLVKKRYFILRKIETMSSKEGSLLTSAARRERAFLNTRTQSGQDIGRFFEVNLSCSR